MRKSFFLSLVLAALIVGAAVETEAVTRVKRPWSVLAFSAGGGLPWGQYDGLQPFDFIINYRPVDVEADSVYETAFYLGASYGQQVGRRFLVSVGFRYTGIAVRDTIPLSVDTIMIMDPLLSWNQYDVDVDVNMYLADPSAALLAPYLGLGVNAGFNTVGGRGFQTETRATAALSLNLGFDLRLFGNRRSFVTLSSANTWNLAASDDRPRYINIGAALKYWFKP